jgi:hypothetical protein
VLATPEIEYHRLHRARTALLCGQIGQAPIQANALGHLRPEADALEVLAR